MNGPDVSVLIAARDEERLLPGCLDSVAAQDLGAGRVEAVVIANGCSDGTAGVARAWAAAHPDVPLTLLELPQGNISAALNAGTDAARGRLCVIVDGDSRMEPALARRIVEQADAGWPAGTIRIVADSDDRLDRWFFQMLEVGKRRGALGMMFYAPREALIDAGGFDPSLALGADLATQQRIVARGVPFRYLGDTAIRTSPRRLRRLPLRLGMVTMLARWTASSVGIWRDRPY